MIQNLVIKEQLDNVKDDVTQLNSDLQKLTWKRWGTELSNTASQYIDFEWRELLIKTSSATSTNYMIENHITKAFLNANTKNYIYSGSSNANSVITLNPTTNEIYIDTLNIGGTSYATNAKGIIYYK